MVKELDLLLGDLRQREGSEGRWKEGGNNKRELLTYLSQTVADRMKMRVYRSIL